MNQFKYVEDIKEYCNKNHIRNDTKLRCQFITKHIIEDKIKEYHKKSIKTRTKEREVAIEIKLNMELNKKYDNIDWIEYNNYNIENMSNIELNLFNYHICEIKRSHHLVNKFIIKRNIYIKYKLDDYKIHKRLVELFDTLKTDVIGIIGPYNIYENHCNGNLQNYKNNIAIYF